MNIALCLFFAARGVHVRHIWREDDQSNHVAGDRGLLHHLNHDHQAHQCRHHRGHCLRDHHLMVPHSVLCAMGLMKNYKRRQMIPGTSVSYWSEDVWVVTVEPVNLVAGQMDFSGFLDGSLWSAVFTFLYVDLLDTTATLFAMAKFAGLMDAQGNFEGQRVAFVVDGFMTSIGATLGTSPVTTYIESAPGIEEGGRTGLTAITTGFWFFLSIFFAPILASVPPWATGPALIIVGAMMMKGIVAIDWKDYGQAIPATHLQWRNV
eukprot:scaffold116710_cov43-Prasinocladus_malaysianus.AAC.1